MAWNCPKCGTQNGIEEKSKGMGFLGVATLTVVTFGIFFIAWAFVQMMKVATPNTDGFSRKCKKCNYRIF